MTSVFASKTPSLGNKEDTLHALDTRLTIARGILFRSRANGAHETAHRWKLIVDELLDKRWQIMTAPDNTTKES
jgi:hypothetical protein